MHVLRDRRPPRIRLWCDWLLLAAGLVALLVPLELIADAAYRSDQSVLYWWLIAYSYLDGEPAATAIGLVALALALLAYWIGLRLLLRAGLALVALTILTGISAAFTLMLAYVASGAGALASGLVILGGGLFSAALLLGRRAVVSTSRARGSTGHAADVVGDAGPVGAHRRRDPARRHGSSPRVGYRRAVQQLLPPRQRQLSGTSLLPRAGADTERRFPGAALSLRRARRVVPPDRCTGHLG